MFNLSQTSNQEMPLAVRMERSNLYISLREKLVNLVCDPNRKIAMHFLEPLKLCAYRPDFLEERHKFRGRHPHNQHIRSAKQELY
jgi:hypothetical protein